MVVPSCNGTLLSDDYEGTTDTQNSMDASQMHCASEEKPKGERKGHKPYDPTYMMTFSKMPKLVTEQTSSSQGSVRGEGCDYERDTMREFF